MKETPRSTPSGRSALLPRLTSGRFGTSATEVRGQVRAREGVDRRTVLIVHPSNDLYGSDRMAMESATALAADSPVTLLVPSTGPLTGLAPAQVVVRVQPFKVLRKSDASTLLGRGLLFLRIVTVEVVRAVRELRRLRPGAVYVNTVICPQWIVAARILRLPVITHVHETERGLPLTLQRALLAAPAVSSAVIANSQSTAAWISAVWPRAARRVTVVRNGVARPPNIAERAPSGSRPPTAVVVGRLSERKGQLVAVRAFAQAAPDFPDARLVLVGKEFGGPGAVTRMLREEVARLGLGDRVEFAGQTDDPWPCFDAADIVLMPSLQESFGNVAVESGLAGRAVIASDVEGLVEIVEPGVTGWLLPSGDVQAFAGALREAFGDPLRTAAMGAAAQAHVARRFGLDAYHSGIRDRVRRLDRG